jgi:hypothetical protein
MYLYGITQEQYDEMYAAQGGKCALCGSEFTAIPGKHSKGTELNLCIDHSHKDGHIRSMIHRKCNLGLGKFDDSIEKIEMALAYLKRYGE